MLSLMPLALLIGDYEGNRHMDWGNRHMDWGGGHMDWGGGWWIVILVMMIVFGGLAVYLLVREFGSRRDQVRTPDSEDALMILDRRLADGSISPDEYRERRAILTETRSSESGPG